MNFTRFNSNIVARSLRLVVVAFACSMILFSSVLPAAAVGSFPSNPTKGEENLTEIQRKTDEAIINPPMGLKDIQKRTQAQKGGINEIQGAADVNKMSTPENAKQSTSILDEIKESLNIVKDDK